MLPDPLARLQDHAPPGLQPAPPVFTEMGAEIVGYAEGESMTVRFPSDARSQIRPA